MSQQTISLPIRGMDCSSCALHIQTALGELSGVVQAQVLFSAEKALITFDDQLLEPNALVQTIEQAGYQVPQLQAATPKSTPANASLLLLFGAIVLVVLGFSVLGEQLGWLDLLIDWIPWPIGVALVLVAGYRIFWRVLQAAWRKTVLSHSLMSIGVIAALAIGQWPTALLVVLFMRIGEYVEQFTASQARRAVKELTVLAPTLAQVERDGAEIQLPIEVVQVGDVVVVRPGDQIPVDGVVLRGAASINQATITGESMPIDAIEGTHVFAATLATAGSLRIRATAVGRDSTFGNVIKLVEEAESQKAEIQRIGDAFSGYYLPVVAALAVLTFVLQRDPLATAAVLLVACSCSFALATPIAMLATIGAAAKQGILIKGGKYLEALAKTSVVLIDKTGTLTHGQPVVTQVVVHAAANEAEVLGWAAAAEQDSEHALAKAIVQAARDQSIDLGQVSQFKAMAGSGVQAVIEGQTVVVGHQRLLGEHPLQAQANALEQQGQTVIWVLREQKVLGLIACADRLRVDVAPAIAQLRRLGIDTIEILTGDNQAIAANIAEQLGIGYQAELLPADKLAIVRHYQAQGQHVVMIGDGVNDAPALAQAHVGIAMGVAGTAVALDAAHIALLRDDWSLVPQALALALGTMRIVKGNLGFTVAYNMIGLSLAALGILPPVLAAAAQSLPDLGIMVNSARLLRYKPEPSSLTQ
ncbi:cation-translocating P-type ATPase [Herpetosiphon gulosus]|uniref:Copper-exporting P-type ATPase n=1 Tax=Herpetosiphon gulosus TaxID=1973496 RepID=A0ABP9X4B8_9CHLR